MKEEVKKNALKRQRKDMNKIGDLIDKQSFTPENVAESFHQAYILGFQNGYDTAKEVVNKMIEKKMEVSK